VNLADLDGRLFASTAEVASILDGLDPRTVRRAIAAGEIPARRVGTKLLIPVTWLREQVAGSAPESASASLDVDQLADSVADRVIARLACAFGGMTSDVITAGPAPPGPAATADIPHPQPTGRKSRAQDTSAT
jgi:excisionase family DNA binding protein